jgi:Uma2 family endonuclease
MNLPISALRTPRPFPTMWDLPSQDPSEPGLPDQFHGVQPQILHETLYLPDYSPQERFVGFDMNLYYDLNHTGWHKRPDWFLVVGVPHLYGGRSLRSSYVTWDEGVVPSVVIEFLSPGTDDEDLGRFGPKPPVDVEGKPPSKFTVYEQILKIPHYLVFDEETGQLRYFRLVGDRYEEQVISVSAPQAWLPSLNIGLAVWEGEYRDSMQPWMRWCDASGNLFPTLREEQQQTQFALNLQTQMLQQTQAENAMIQAEKEVIQAEKEAAIEQTRQAVRRLLAIGLSVEQVAETFGLSSAQVEEMA